MPSDPLSETLSIANARAFYEGSLSASGLWSVHFPAPAHIKLLIVARGSCWLAVDGNENQRHIGWGDVVVLSRSRAFDVFTDYARRPVDGPVLLANAAQSSARLGRGDEFLMLFGYVSLEPLAVQAPDATSPRGLDLAADFLPPIVHLQGACNGPATLSWLAAQLIQEHALESNGFASASSHIANLMFVHILRLQLERQESTPIGWFRLLSDKLLARAVRLIHEDPARHWSLSELASASGMSKTSFATQFKAVAGVSPVQYLTHWRIRLAKRALHEQDISLAELARSLGYTSESVFSHAFKRETGLAPTSVRRPRSGA